MKRKNLLGLLLMMSGLSLFTTVRAQSDLVLTMNKEGKIIAIPRKNHYELNIPPWSYKSYTPSSSREIESKLRQFVPDIPSTPDERPMDMQVQSAAYRPYFDVFTPMLQQVSPMALDFNETSVVSINDDLYFLTNGRQYTWPGAGGLTVVEPSLAWRTGRWTLSVGAFGGKFYTPFNVSPKLMGGVNAQVKYEATDWLALRAWGQYATYGNENENPHMLLNPFYNHTSVGGAMEFKFNDNFGIGAGVNYEYNPIRRKMEPQYLIYPIFRSRNIRIGW